jgi:hypothetical protein
MSDNLSGLAFAIHLLYSYSVKVSNIVCDWEASKYKATVNIEMTDHFGMDYGDVDEFGTAEKVSQKARKGPTAMLATGTLLGLTSGSLFLAADKSKSDESKSKAFNASGFVTATVSAITLVVGGIFTGLSVPVAPGFRAWFILQHYHGCRPFKIVIHKTLDIEGIIPKE